MVKDLKNGHISKTNIWVRKPCNENFGNCGVDCIFDGFAGYFVILKAFQLSFVIFFVVVGTKLVCARGHIDPGLGALGVDMVGIASDAVTSGSVHNEANSSFGCSIGGKFFGQGHGAATQLNCVFSVRLAAGVQGSEQCCGGHSGSLWGTQARDSQGIEHGHVGWCGLKIVTVLKNYPN